MHSGTILERKLIERIHREGPLTFRSFMQSALYDPKHGYYNTERLKIGPGGDYYTSSNVHAAFGAVLARVFAGLFNELDKNSDHLAIAEVGAGTGQLAVDILSAIRDEHRSLFNRLSYAIVETSPAMRSRQQQRLVGFGDRVQWQTLAELARSPFPRIVFSNELVDALPVHRVRKWGGRLQESYVTVPGAPAGGCDEGTGERRSSSLEESSSPPGGTRDHLTFAWGEPSTSRLDEYLTRSRVTLVDGQIAEIGLDAVDWLAEASRAIENGFLVTIDYGDEAGLLYGSDRRNGTLRSFQDHALRESTLDRVGEQDLTASVNFTALIEHGSDCGLETVSYERQATFLIRNGLIDRIAAIETSSGGVIDDLGERLAVKNLFVPGGVSDNFRVLIQRKRRKSG
jgi:SAM-dependent MidA family methyltransferase